MHSAYEHFRQMKDSFFATDPHSPLTPDQRATFSGLAYFPVDEGLVFDLEVETFDAQETVALQTSTGDVQSYDRWGRIHFELDGEAASLTIYSNQHGLFLPFRDATSGQETYGAGRYLEPELLGGGKVHVDFNLAYSPYCAYNDFYSCPIPPLENRLKVPIRAGEKNFK